MNSGETRERKTSQNIQKNNIVRAKFTDICEDYKFESIPVGSGGFGNVYKGTHKATKQVRAIKHIKFQENLSTVDRSSKSNERNLG